MSNLYMFWYRNTHVKVNYFNENFVIITHSCVKNTCKKLPKLIYSFINEATVACCAFGHQLDVKSKNVSIKNPDFLHFSQYTHIYKYPSNYNVFEYAIQHSPHILRCKDPVDLITLVLSRKTNVKLQCWGRGGCR